MFGFLYVICVVKVFDCFLYFVGIRLFILKKNCINVMFVKKYLIVCLYLRYIFVFIVMIKNLFVIVVVKVFIKREICEIIFLFIWEKSCISVVCVRKFLINC